MKRLKNYINSLDENVTMNRKLVFYRVLTAFLSGVVLGFLFAPAKSVTIGSNNANNGNGNGCGNTSEEDED